MEIFKKNQCRFQWIMVHHVTEQRCHLYICIKNTNVNRTFSASSQSTANIPVSDRGPEDNYADLRPWLQTMHFHECEETLHENSNSLPISKRTAEQTLGCDFLGYVKLSWCTMTIPFYILFKVYFDIMVTLSPTYGLVLSKP